MAVDCLAGYLYELEKDGEKYPGATAMKDISLEKIAKELDVEMKDVFVNMISVDVDEYAKNHNKVVPRTLTIWNIYNCVSKKPKHEKLISFDCCIIDMYVDSYERFSTGVCCSTQ